MPKVVPRVRANVRSRASARPPARLGRKRIESWRVRMSSTVRRQGLALFERQMSARVRGVLVMAGGRSTAMTS